VLPSLALSQVIDLKEGDGVVRSASSSDKADCTLSLSDSDFVLLMTGKLNPQAAFMKGKLKVKGNVLLAQKLSALMPQKQTKPKPTSDDTADTPDSKDSRPPTSKL
jgi:putative sterol carrier protein